MKKIFLALLLLCSNAFAAITDGKFGINQIFDVQYWWNGTTLNASNFIAPYNKNFQTVTATTGQYFQFFASTTNPGTHGLKLMNSNGTLHSIVHDHGDITALGNGAIFYIGSGFFGNVISTAQGYNYGASAQFTNMDTSVSSSDLDSYTFASSTPLSAGQTAAPTAPAAPPAPTYVSNISIGQQTKVDAWRARTVQQGIYIEQIGDNNIITVVQQGNKNLLKGITQQAAYLNGDGNNITVRQRTDNTTNKNDVELELRGDGNAVNLNQGYNTNGTAAASQLADHYQLVNINGNANSVTTLQQRSSGTYGNYMETTVSGNNNIVNQQQTGDAKILFTNINGGNNGVSTVQKDAGQKYLDIKLNGSGHTVNAVQEGLGNHRATIDLTNGGGASTVNLNQAGSTTQIYNIQQTCGIAGGCATTVTQQ